MNLKGRLRGMARRAVLDLACGLESMGSEEFPSGPSASILCLHHLPQGDEANLEKVLVRLGRSFSFVSYTEIVDRISGSRLDKAYLALTFDDGLHFREEAVRMFLRIGVAPCIFVNPGIVGETESDRISAYFDRIDTPPRRMFDWSELESLVQRGFEVGGHTLLHHNMARMPIDALQADIRETRSILVERLGRARHFAIPFGRMDDVTREGVDAVYAAGFDSCASAVRGSHFPVPGGQPAEPLRILRQHAEAGWPFRHVRHFLSKGLRSSDRSAPTWSGLGSSR